MTEEQALQYEGWVKSAFFAAMLIRYGSENVSKPSIFPGFKCTEVTHPISGQNRQFVVCILYYDGPTDYYHESVYIYDAGELVWTSVTTGRCSLDTRRSLGDTLVHTYRSGWFKGGRGANCAVGGSGYINGVHEGYRDNPYQTSFHSFSGKESLIADGGNVHVCNHYRGGFTKPLKVEVTTAPSDGEEFGLQF
jgi:hypothetical protein